jgi:two-component system, NarL family, invasion response regulator UvrY
MPYRATLPVRSKRGALQEPTLSLLAKGKTYDSIAEELDVSYKTVVNVSAQLKKKLEVDSLSALVQKATQLLPPTNRLEDSSE